jgi:hypothetical protein
MGAVGVSHLCCEFLFNEKISFLVFTLELEEMHYKIFFFFHTFISRLTKNTLEHKFLYFIPNLAYLIFLMKNFGLPFVVSVIYFLQSSLKIYFTTEAICTPGYM